MSFGIAYDYGDLPKIVAVHSLVNVSSALGGSSSTENVRIVNSYRNYQCNASVLESPFKTDATSDNIGHNYLVSQFFDASDTFDDIIKQERTEELPSCAESSCLVSTASSIYGQTSLDSKSCTVPCSLPCISAVSVRTSTTKTSTVASTRAPGHSVIGKEKGNPGLQGNVPDTVMTYCYSSPRIPVNKHSKLKPHKIPYKVIGNRSVDEQKFARWVWSRIKHLDFTMAFAKIVQYLRRLNDSGVRVSRARLLKILRQMIQTKRKERTRESFSPVPVMCS